jgi:23S rRNA (cytidine1920-2'-O)/16S rRNA (cytidine1409-2'-O)-methyltransferase
MIPPPADATNATPLGVARVVSRGFFKLQHALHTFEIDAQGLACADLGASVGGFSQCLLACGARRVIAVDTARGILDYAVRRDDRVRAIERANALHLDADERVDLVVIDLGWTPQKLALPAAATWLADGGRIISLIKPHYERGEHLTSEEDAHRIAHETVSTVGELGFTCEAITRSPIAGSRRKGKSAKSGTGNLEWLALFTPAQTDEAVQPGCV